MTPGRGATPGAYELIERNGAFDLSRTPHFAGITEYGFASGSSTHQNRLDTIRAIYRDFGQIIDTHTADGVKVGMEHREEGVPLVCLETALAVKFARSIREALGRDPEIPAGLENLELLPQRFTVLDPDVIAVRVSSTAIAEALPPTGCFPSNRIERSTALMSLVRLPIEMRSTPVSAIARTFPG